MADTDALPQAERSFVARLLAEAPGLADAIAVAKRLNRLLRHKSEEELGKVLEHAANTPLAEFASYPGEEGLTRGLVATRRTVILREAYWGGPSMPGLPIRGELSPVELRRLARREDDGRVGRRLLAIANALDGMRREMAARAAAMDRQTLRDWA